MPTAANSCNHGCVCHHDANGRIQPPCYTCTIHQCSLAYRPSEPSAPPEDVIINHGLLQVPPQARSPSADSHYGWRRTLTRIPSNRNRTATNIMYAADAPPATYQEATGVTTIQVSGPSNNSSTEPNRSFRELYVRLPSESAVAHSYPALSTIAASNEPTLLIADTDEGAAAAIHHTAGRTQEYEDIPDDVSIDYSMSEEESDDESLNNEANRINQFPLPRISVPKKTLKQKTKKSSKLVPEDFSETEQYASSRTKNEGLLKTIIRNNSAWGSSDESSVSSKYKIKGKMCKQNHLNIPGIVHQHYAMHKENRNPVYDTRKKVYQSRDYEERWQNLHTWMGHATSEEL